MSSSPVTDLLVLVAFIVLLAGCGILGPSEPPLPISVGVWADCEVFEEVNGAMASLQDLYVKFEKKFIYSDHVTSCDVRDADRASFWITRNDEGRGVLLAEPCEYSIFISQEILDAYDAEDSSHDNVIDSIKLAVC